MIFIYNRQANPGSIGAAHRSALPSTAERPDYDSSNRRRGFTLLEVTLVLAVLVMSVALAWPNIKHSLEINRLKSTAQQVQAAFDHARVQAMSTGITQVFRFEPQSGQYWVDVLPEDSAGLDSSAADTTASAAATPGDNTASTDSSVDAARPAASGTAQADGSSPDRSSNSACAHKLPDGIAFTSGDKKVDSRDAATASELTSASDSANAPPVMFYSDGTTSEAVVTVANQSGWSISVSLRALTGIARAGDVFKTEAAK